MYNMYKGKSMEKGKINWIKRVDGKINWCLILIIIVSVIQSALMVLFALFIKELINSAITDNPDINNVIKNAIICVVLLIVPYTLLVFVRVLNDKNRIEFEVTLKNKVFASILKKDYGQITNFKSGELLNRINNDTKIVANGYSQIPVAFFTMTTKMILVVGVLFAFQPIFTAFLVVGGIVIMGVSFIFRRFSKKLYKKTRKADGKSDAYINESISNLLVVKVFSAQDKTQNKSEELIKKYERCAKNQRYLAVSMSSIMSFAFSFFYIAIVVWGAFCLYYKVDGMDFGVLTAMIQLVSQIQTPFANFTSIFSVYFEMLASMERIDQILCLDEDKPITLDENKVTNFKSIVAKNLGFSYDREQVLIDVNFTINKGDLVLIKGRSGMGKSTILKLILGVYPNKEGNLYIQTENEEIALNSSTRNIFSYVPQQNLLLSGTIRENICFLADNPTKEEIDKVIDVCELGFINDFPKGLETEIGENSQGISEGQAQRIAIARAILSKRKILLLDEATSALDEKTEKSLLEKLYNAYGNDLTIVLISHKKLAETICNKVLTVKNGIVESN